MELTEIKTIGDIHVWLKEQEDQKRRYLIDVASTPIGLEIWRYYDGE